MIGKMTKAFNKVGSTLKAGYGDVMKSAQMGQFKSGMRMGAGSMSGLGGVKGMAGLKSYGQGMMGRWNNATGMQKAGMGAAYGGAAMGGAAAADFLNPWGLGFGD